MYQPVDFKRLENWHHIDPLIIDIIQQHYGSDIIGIPYMWGTTGLTYNTKLIKQRMPDAPLDSYSLVFDPDIVSRFADCGVSLLDGASTVMPMVMLYLGLPPNSVEPEHLKQAEAVLKSIRPYIKYISSTKMLLDLPSEEVCIAMSWSGDYAIASNRAKEAGLDIELAYVLPKEGILDWYDNAYIPVDAPHPNNAYLFLDYILRPEIIAKATNYIGYANANKDATPFVDPIISNDLAIYPDQETMKRMHPTILLEPKLERRRSRAWTKFKSGL
ncbi:MAG: putrescine transport system substrate-binding protein [Oceanicoccus sp.]